MPPARRFLHLIHSRPVSILGRNLPARERGLTMVRDCLFGLVIITASGGCLAQEPCSSPAEACAQAPTRTVRNVRGQALKVCSINPMTGWFRDGRCNTDENDRGRHLVCAEMTSEFLSFTKNRGNDLSTPSPRHRFPGLSPGDRWCLCALRWKEAHEAGVAPPVILEATHSKTTQFVPETALKAQAVSAP